jgi:hypothetical protein
MGKYNFSKDDSLEAKILFERQLKKVERERKCDPDMDLDIADTQAEEEAMVQEVEEAEKRATFYKERLEQISEKIRQYREEKKLPELAHRHFELQSYYDGYNDPETLRKKNGGTLYGDILFIEPFKTSSAMLSSFHMFETDHGMFSAVAGTEKIKHQHQFQLPLWLYDEDKLLGPSGVCRVENKTILHKGKQYTRHVYFAASMAFVYIEKRVYKVLLSIQGLQNFEKETPFTTDRVLEDEERIQTEKEANVERAQRTEWQKVMVNLHSLHR